MKPFLGRCCDAQHAGDGAERRLCYALCYAPCYTGAMATITHRELRNNSADVLRRVAAGEAMEVTNHGVVVAHLSPVASPLLPFPVSRPARRIGGWTSLPKVALGRPVSEIIDGEREDR